MKNSENEHKKLSEMLVWLQAYAGTRINSCLIDERRCIPPYIVLDLGNQGFFGICVPREFSGMEMGLTSCCRIGEALSAIDPSISSMLMIHTILGVYPLLNYGQKEIKEKYLPQLAAGRILGTLAYTEPGAGSSAGAIMSTGIYNGNHAYELNGKKIWIGNASWSGLINVFIKAVNREGEEHITGFCIPQGTPGLEMGYESATMGMHGMVQNNVILNHVLAKEEWLLGTFAQGSEIRDNTFNLARIVIGACCLGVMKRSLQLWLRYASKRHISTGLLLDNSVTISHFSECSYKIACLESLIYLSVQEVDSGTHIPKEIFLICKIIGSEWGNQVVDRAFQGIGGRAYSEPNQLSQLYRDIRLTRIFEGPTETLMLYLGISFLRFKSPLLNFITNRLNAGDIALSLSAAVNSLKDRIRHEYKGSPFHHASEILYLTVADIVCYALLYAAVKFTSKGSACPLTEKAEQWAALNYHSKKDAAILGSKSEKLTSSAADIIEMVNSYQNSIGNIEQTLKGVDDSLDVFLKK